MSSFHSVMHRSAVDVWARWSPWRHTTGRKCRSWLLSFLSLFLPSYQYTKQLHLSLIVRCRRTSWVEQCLCSLHFHGLLHFVHMQVNEEEFALKEILYSTTTHSILAQIHCEFVWLKSAPQCTMQILVNRMEVPAFLHSSIHFQSPASWQPKALFFPATWVPACRVCVFGRLLPAKAAQHRSSPNPSPVTAQSIRISGDNIRYWAACKSALVSVHCRLYLLSFLSPSSPALTLNHQCHFLKSHWTKFMPGLPWRWRRWRRWGGVFQLQSPLLMPLFSYLFLFFFFLAT